MSPNGAVSRVVPLTACFDILPVFLASSVIIEMPYEIRLPGLVKDSSEGFVSMLLLRKSFAQLDSPDALFFLDGVSFVGESLSPLLCNWLRYSQDQDAGSNRRNYG